MSHKSASPITEPNIPNSLRCIFTNARKERCSNPHHGSASNICPFHERLLQKQLDDEAKSISEELLNGGEALATNQQLNRAMSKLFQLIAQKRIGRHDGILLATSAVSSSKPSIRPDPRAHYCRNDCLLS